MFAVDSNLAGVHYQMGLYSGITPFIPSLAVILTLSAFHARNLPGLAALFVSAALAFQAFVQYLRHNRLDH